jgi:hypothetical protein
MSIAVQFRPWSAQNKALTGTPPDTFIPFHSKNSWLVGFAFHGMNGPSSMSKLVWAGSLAAPLLCSRGRISDRWVKGAIHDK